MAAQDYGGGYGGYSPAGGAAAGAAGAATGGMGAFLLPLLMHFGPALFSKLFGGNPQADLRKKIAQLTSAQNMGKQTDKFYQTAISSPAYSQAQGTIAAGANATGGQIASKLGASGIGTTGTGAILGSVVPSIVGNQQAGLRTSAYQGAQDQAQNYIQQQLSALTGTQGPSQTQQMFGAGLSSFSPYLLQYLKSKYPQMFGSMQTPQSAGTF